MTVWNPTERIDLDAKETRLMSQDWVAVRDGVIHDGLVCAEFTRGEYLLAQVMIDGQLTRGSVWIVPGDLYPPIRQDAVLLATGRDQPAARALIDYLRGEKAKAIIQSYGYDL